MNPTDLTPHRIQLHYAIQFAAAVGSALGNAAPDGSQVTLDWDDTLHVFVGKPIPSTALQIALVPASLTSVILQNGGAIATQSLIGLTMTEALAWHKSQLATLGVSVDQIHLLDYPPNDFPDHPLAHGAVFEDGDPEARAAIASYYAKTRPLLAAVVAANSAASAIAIWPHHFDMATLMTYSGAPEADTKYLGVGLSPGDTSYPEPYWYISPYPYPDSTKLPKLNSRGFWHTEHWVGAVLTASQIEEDAEIQSFIDSAIAASKEVLNVSTGR